MDSVGMLGRLTRLAVPALVALCFSAALALSGPSPAEARTCHTAAQSITKLKNVSCKRAKKVANRANRAGGTEIPECRGEPVEKWHGWKFKATGNRGIVIRVSKGNRRFLLSGGGAC